MVKTNNQVLKGGEQKMQKEITLKECTCERCGHVWLPRSEETPITCSNPRCRSPYWNIPRKRQFKDVKELKKESAKQNE